MQSELVVISTVVEVEYDGYMKFSIRLSPTGTSVREGFDVKADCMKRHIDKLWLEIPLKSNIAKFVHNSGWPIGAKSEELKENKSQLFPVNWYGNDECGLGIYFESDQNWRSFKREEAVECIFCDDNRILRYHLLDSAPKCWEKEDTLRPTSDARGTERTPVFFEFALQATPIKKFDETQVRNHIVHIDCFEKIYIPYSDFLMGKVNDMDDTIVMDKLKSGNVNILTLHQAWNPIQGYWKLDKKHTERLKLIVDEAHKRGIKVMLYFCDSLSTLRPEGEDFMLRNAHFHWYHIPDISFYRTPPQRIYRTCTKSEELFDTLIAGMSEAIENFNVDGIYLDSATIPWGCTNEKHGCGYIDEYNKLHPTYPVHATHSSMQRMYEEITGRLGKPIHIHAYNSFFPAALGYSDTTWNGEQVAFGCGSDTEAIIASFTQGFMRTEMTGRNIGVNCQMLAYELPDKSWDFKKALSVCVPYGIYPRPNSVYGPLDVMIPLWKALDTFDPATCQWHPFWQEGTGAYCNNETIKISSYSNDALRILIVANPSTEKLDNVSITLTDCQFNQMIYSSDSDSNITVYDGKIEADLPPFTTLLVECKLMVTSKNS